MDAELFHEKRSKKLFRDVTIGCGIQSASLEEKAIFTRLTPVIYDTISHDLDRLGMYEKNTSFPKDKSEYEALYITAIYTVKRGALTTNQIKKAVEMSLKKIDLAPHQAELENYLNGFLSTPTWNDIPIEFYRHSGMLVSRKKIAELFTPANAQAVIDKLEVAVRPTQQMDWS